MNSVFKAAVEIKIINIVVVVVGFKADLLPAQSVSLLS